MKIAIIISSIIALSLLSCSNDDHIVKVPDGKFSYVPQNHWHLAFEVNNENHMIYNALYEIRSEELDTVIAAIYIYAQHLDNDIIECQSFKRYDRSSLQRAFQKKYSLNETDLCKIIDTKKLVYCDGEGRVDFEFQNDNTFIQCNMNITVLSQPQLYNESKLIDDFDSFIRSFTKL